ncbi:acyl-CoA dehydrogenase [Streptomyces sp. Je 1-332]|uniref:acyl-CoA dehydrogenase family protein n=1 Tax=Streptomyces sp. Je 1-332 TaxID=3231270 RepID=UPI00345ADD5C
MTTAARPGSAHLAGADPAEELTALLDGLTGPGEPFSVEALAALDRAETFPDEACRVLDAFGLPRYYVPVEHGGALDDFSVVMQLLRGVSRVDLTVAAAHGKTYLGAVSTWIAGDSGQAARLGQRIIDGAVVSCALTERHHGSDLLAGEVVGTRTEGTAGSSGVSGGLRLSGEKWLINNVTRADLVTVLARTDEAGGPLGFSLFLVDKEQLAPDQYTDLPKVPTYGIRGAAIGGIAFHDAPLADGALVGRTGQGVEIILKSLHVTRTGCVAMSLGAGDHALGLAARFAARTRTQSGRSLAELPLVRAELGEATATLLLAEATSVVAVRSVHALTGEMSVVSAVAKASVPAYVDDLIARLFHLLGPHGLAGPGDPHGEFAKVERDHRIIGIFDGSSLVNRNALIDQFPRLARAYRKGRWDAAGLAAATTARTAPGPFRTDSLNLISSSGASVVASLPVAAAEVRHLADEGLASEGLADLAARLHATAGRLHEDMAGARFAPRAVPVRGFELAERFELCFGAAAALHLWLRGAEHAGAGADDTWLRGCLVKALTDLGEHVEETERRVHGELADALLARPAGPGAPYSLLDRLAAAPGGHRPGPAPDTQEASAS